MIGGGGGGGGGTEFVELEGFHGGDGSCGEFCGSKGWNIMW